MLLLPAVCTWMAITWGLEPHRWTSPLCRSSLFQDQVIWLNPHTVRLSGLQCADAHFVRHEAIKNGFGHTAGYHDPHGPRQHLKCL